MPEKQKIIFRADANNKIGYGHFFRTLALTDMLKDDFECIFLTINPNEFQKAELSKVCKYQILPEGNQHYSILQSLLKGNEIVVLDNYYYSNDFYLAIKSTGCKVVSFHYRTGQHYITDLVISQFLTNQKSFSIEPYTKLCLGFRWVLLRQSFIEAAIKHKSKVRNSKIEKIVICFGGADMYDLTGKTIRILSELNTFFQIDAIIADNFSVEIPDTINIKLTVHKNVSSFKIAQLFTESDLSIVSASMVCVEALACNASVAAGYFVENQVETYSFLNENKFITGLGNYLEDYRMNLINCIKKNNIPGISFTENYDLGNLKSRYIQVFKDLMI